MSHRQGKFSPTNQKSNVSPANHNPTSLNVEYEEAMEVEQSQLNSNMEFDNPARLERSPNLNQDDRYRNLFDAMSVHNNPGVAGSFNQLDDDSNEVYDENDEARASGVIHAEFKNIFRHKQAATRNDVRVLGGTPIIRCLPWKILVIFHPPETHSTIGVFVQCNADSDSQTWSCNAKALIQLVAQHPNGVHKEMVINHTFTHKENDWGFQQFISYVDLFNPERGFLSPTEPKDTIIIRALIKADAPHGADWDSKRHTGFVGLKNQGATCYLNSLLQALYCTNKLRRAVFLMPTESDDAQTSVPLALQRVFYELQFSVRAVGTKKLTRSFGWATLDSFMQHDAQELCRVLLDNLENKMKGTSVEDVIPGLFCGKMLSYINCLSVNYSSKREENFYDIQLKVNGNRSVYDAFIEYIAKETLSQDNKYDAGAYGLQEAEKGVIFTRFPPVLYLQLMRFQYDFVADTNIKLNDRFEFPYILKLDQFLADTKPSIYILHAVLVHSGDNHGGHYVVYINPALNGTWYQFDDDVVSRCSAEDAINMNFGGSNDPEVRVCTNAYMLVYIAETAKDDVLCPVYETDIPESLRERFVDEQRIEEAKRKQKEKVHLYAAMHLFLEEDFYGWQGLDLCSQDYLPYRLLRMQKQISRTKLIEEVATILNNKPENVRLWRFQPRRKSMPAHLIELNDTQPLYSMKDSFIFYAQFITQSEQNQTLPTTDKHLFFLKYFDPVNWSLSFCGSVELRRDEPLRALESIIQQRVGLDSNCKLTVYQDDAKTLITEITQLDVPVAKLYKREIQGQVLYFQVKSANHNVPLPFGLLKPNEEVGSDALVGQNPPVSENVNDAQVVSATNAATVDQFRNGVDSATLYKTATFPAAISTKSLTSFSSPNQHASIDSPGQSTSPSTEGPSLYDYFSSYVRRFELLLVDKLRPHDAGFLIHVSADLTYWEFAKLAASYLSTEANHLQFFRSQQVFGNSIDPVTASAPIYVSPVGPTIASSDLNPPPPPSGVDINANSGGPNSGASADGTGNAAGFGGTLPRSVYINPHALAANASGFINCSPYIHSLVIAAATQGLSKEPPGAAISSTHSGSMQDFFLSFSVTPANNAWTTDPSLGSGMITGGNPLAGGGGNNNIPDRLPHPLNRFGGVAVVNRSPFGPISFQPPRRVYYAHLAIRIDELETMRQVRVVYVTSKLSEKAEILLSAPQNGLVSDLLKEANRHLVLPAGGSGQLRLLKVSRNRIIQEYPINHKLSSISESTVFPQTYVGSTPIHSLRIEEVPLDELKLKPDETIVYVSHFDKAFTETFGIPFTVRIRDGEAYSVIRERIRKRLEVPEKEFDRWRFAVIFPNEGTYIPNEEDPIVQIKSFTHQCLPENRPWLGIDHKPSKRPRYAPNEKPIKIHN